jgi:octopine/nopaline transport system substrate-binding protein
MQTFRSALLGLALAAVGATLATPSYAKTWSEVTIAMEGAYEPWNLTKPDGSLGGFEPELIKDVCDRIKLKCKLIIQDWDGAIPGLQAHKFDVIMDALSITEDRKKVIAFSIPYAATPAVFVSLKDQSTANLPGTGTTITLGLDKAEQMKAVAAMRTALKGKTIGIQSSTVYATFIYDNFKDIATIREYKTSPEHDLDLLAGRIDVAFDDATYFTTAMAKPENATLAFTGPQYAGPIWGPGEGLGFRKSDTDLKEIFDPGLKAALADGTVKRLSLKWFKINVQPK